MIDLDKFLTATTEANLSHLFPSQDGEEKNTLLEPLRKFDLLESTAENLPEASTLAQVSAYFESRQALIEQHYPGNSFEEEKKIEGASSPVFMTVLQDVIHLALEIRRLAAAAEERSDRLSQSMETSLRIIDGNKLQRVSQHYLGLLGQVAKKIKAEIPNLFSLARLLQYVAEVDMKYFSVNYDRERRCDVLPQTAVDLTHVTWLLLMASEPSQADLSFEDYELNDIYEDDERKVLAVELTRMEQLALQPIFSALGDRTDLYSRANPRRSFKGISAADVGYQEDYELLERAYSQVSAKALTRLERAHRECLHVFFNPDCGSFHWSDVTGLSEKLEKKFQEAGLPEGEGREDLSGQNLLKAVNVFSAVALEHWKTVFSARLSFPHFVSCYFDLRGMQNVVKKLDSFFPVFSRGEEGAPVREMLAYAAAEYILDTPVRQLCKETLRELGPLFNFQRAGFSEESNNGEIYFVAQMILNLETLETIFTETYEGNVRDMLSVFSPTVVFSDKLELAELTGIVSFLQLTGKCPCFVQALYQLVEEKKQDIDHQVRVKQVALLDVTRQSAAGLKKQFSAFAEKMDGFGQRVHERLDRCDLKLTKMEANAPRLFTKLKPISAPSGGPQRSIQLRTTSQQSEQPENQCTLS